MIERIRCEPNRLPKADSDRSRPRQKFSFWQNRTSTPDVSGHNWYSKFDGKQPCTLLERLDLAATGARTFRIEDQIALRAL
jgi:hypothetical protein